MSGTKASATFTSSSPASWSGLARGRCCNLDQHLRQRIDGRRCARVGECGDQAGLGDGQLRRCLDRLGQGCARALHVAAARLPTGQDLRELQARLGLCLGQVRVETLGQPVAMRGVGDHGCVQQGDGAEAVVGERRLQGVHRPVGLPLRLLRPGDQKRAQRVRQRLVRQFGKAQLGLRPVAVMRGVGGQQQLRERVGGQVAGQTRRLRRTCQKGEHERVLAQLHVAGVGRQRVLHARRGERQVALMGGELRHQVVRRVRGPGSGGEQGGGQGRCNSVHQGSLDWRNGAVSMTGGRHRGGRTLAAWITCRQDRPVLRRPRAPTSRCSAWGP